MSSLTRELLERNREIKKNFLVDREIEEANKVPEGQFYGYIYCIENKNTGKKYVGSTYSTWTGVKNPNPLSIMSKRASGYIYEYNSGMKTSSSVKKVLRPVVQAMIDEGIENFIMYPIAETTVKTHTKLENEWIDKLDTRFTGYNGSEAYPLKLTDKSPRRVYTSAQRAGISDPVIAVNMNRKEIICADSMKLLGDRLGTSKDIIKNNVRGARNYKGWFIFYMSKDKRQDIVDTKVIPNDFGIQKRGNTRGLSDKRSRSEERRVGKECRSRWSPYH